MKIYIVQGEHPVAPDNPMTAHATPALADAKARELVNIIRQDALYDLDTESFSLILPQLEGEFDWQEGLREWQRAKLRGEERPIDAETMDDDELADSTEAAVWILTLEVEGTEGFMWDSPPCRPWALNGPSGDPEMHRRMVHFLGEPGPAIASRVLTRAVETDHLSEAEFAERFGGEGDR